MKHVVPLSLNQKNIWGLEQKHTGTPINNICETIYMEGRFDAQIANKALNIVLEADPSLRTQLCLDENNNPVQYEIPFKEQTFPFYDFSQSDTEGLQAFEASFTKMPFMLMDAPLFSFAIFKLSELKGGVIIKIHHIISDGWSQVMLTGRIAKAYAKLCAEEFAEIAPLPLYESYVQKDALYKHSKQYEKDKNYWRKEAEKLQPVSIKEYKSTNISPVGKRKTYELPESLNNEIYSFCQQQRVSPFAVMYMALSLYIKRVIGKDTFCIGVPVFNRMDAAERDTTGMFVSTLPFGATIDEEWSFTAFNSYVAEAWFTLLKHQRLPFAEIQMLRKISGVTDEKLFDIVLSYQNGNIDAQLGSDIHFYGKWHYSGFQQEQLCIHISNVLSERRYEVSYDYLTQLYTEDEIERLHKYLCNILRQGLMLPDTKLRNIPLVDIAEKEQVLFEFNDTYKQIFETNIYEAFLNVCEAYTGRVAVIADGVRYTYGQLQIKANALAHKIAAYGNPGDIVALRLPKGIGLFIGMLAVCQANRAWLILPPDLPLGRTREIIINSKAVLLLCEEPNSEDLFPIENQIIIDDFLGDEVKTAFKCDANKESLAYVVYTSGSTGTPKGVMITHENVLNFAKATSGFYGEGAVLSLCSVGFDAFMLESIGALLCGRTIVLPTEAEAENPAALARLIHQYAVGFIALTPSRLAAYMNNGAFLVAMQKLKAIICGGEAMQGALLQSLKIATSAHIYNQYGPSETTVAVSCQLLNDSTQISIGKPMDGCLLYVLDANRHPCPVGVQGEIYIGGRCVGAGYLYQPELTEKQFLDNPYVYGTKMYKTGDMGYWTPEGEIMLLGRRDAQIKLRGLRIELQEIESRLLSLAGVQQAVAHVAKTIDGVQTLFAFYTGVQQEEILLQNQLSQYLPTYMVPSQISWLPEIPLTQNGKVDYTKLPLQLEVVPQKANSKIAQELVHIFKRVLEKDDVYANSDYFLCGGDSLNALQAIALIEQAYGLQLRVADFVLYKTPEKLAAFIEKTAGEEPELTVPVSLQKQKRDKYPLTKAQHGIYVQALIDKSKIAYNMPGAFVIEGDIDLRQLEQAFIKLVAAEDLLRTSFHMEGQAVYGQVREQVPFSLQKLQGADFDAVSQGFVRSFDFAQAPLLRAGVWQDAQGQNVLFIDIHHIINDGFGSNVLLSKLNALYQGKTLQNAAVNYLDYAVWQQEAEQNNEEVVAYWKAQAETLALPMELSYDYPRKKTFDFAGDVYTCTLSKEKVDVVEAFAKANGITTYAVLMGAYSLLLQRLSLSKTVHVGMPCAGRILAQTESMLGLFMQTLPLSIKVEQDMNLHAYLQHVHSRIVQVLDNTDITMDELVQMAGVERSLQQNPIYQTMFTLRPIEEKNFVLADAQLAYKPLHTKTVKLDLCVEAAYDKDKNMHFAFEYATSLFAPETIELYARSFLGTLENMIGREGVHLDEISTITPLDQYALWEKPNRITTPYANIPLDVQIDQMALRMPNAPAIVYRDQVMTYSVLKERSDALAGYLIRSGAVLGDSIALVTERNADMLVSLIAIAKAGCAYVPILPETPQSRMQYMLEVADAKFLLTDEMHHNQLPSDLPCIVLLQDFTGKPEPVVEGRSPEDLLYILFTSGSTGKPKGVMLPHRALSNLLVSMEKIFAKIEGPVLCTTNVVFDIFISENLLPLALGKPVVLADSEQMMLPWEIANLIHKHNIGFVQFTPSRLQMCMSNEAFRSAMAKVQGIVLVGEALSQTLLSSLQSTGDVRIYNMYGPTEAAVYVTVADLTNATRVDIGTALANCRIYVLDENKKIVMPTAVGELYLAGECLAHGYVNREDLTAEAFVEDPFFPGQKMYKTGDLARLKANGRIDFIGRRDGQVKINGQRIELDEIEGAIVATGLVAEASVVVIDKSAMVKEIRAFVVAKENELLDEAELRSLLQQELPQFMVPTQIVALPKLPRTDSGKTDKKALLNLDIETIEMQKLAKPQPSKVQEMVLGIEPPLNEQVMGQSAETEEVLQMERKEPTKKDLIALWQQALAKDEVSETDSFFEQGGTSLSALNLLSMYYNYGWHISLETFYEQPTLQQQADILGLPNTIARENTVVFSQDSKQENLQKQTILLTGTTGFLGAHLVYALIAAGCEKIYCLVRGEQNRLYETLCNYFGDDWVARNQNKISILQGNICMADFGLVQSELNALKEDIDIVLHSAADVRHYASDADSSLKTNVVGTKNAIVVAEKLEAKLAHISTISVGGEYLLDAPGTQAVFSEQDFSIGQNWQDNIYVKGKFLAEQLVLEAAKADLFTQVFRVGHLVGRQTDGVFQKNPQENSLYMAVQGLAQVGMVPKSLADYPLELTAVDACAKAIVSLLAKKAAVYHMYNPHMRPLNEVAAELAGLSVVEDKFFEHALQKQMQAQSLPELAMLMDFYMKAKKEIVQIVPTADSTVAALGEVKFHWPVPNERILLKAFYEPEEMVKEGEHHTNLF